MTGRAVRQGNMEGERGWVKGVEMGTEKRESCKRH